MNLNSINWEALILGYPVLLLALTVHECAHAWTSNRLGDPTAKTVGRVSLNPLVHMDIFGTVLFPILSFLGGIPLLGWAKPVPVNPLHFRRPSRDNMLVSLAGPISNLALAVVFFSVFAVMPHEQSAYETYGQVMTPLLNIVLYGVLINVLLTVFNLIPVPPLDGSHVLEHFLPYQARQTYQRVEPFGFFILLALFYTGIMDYLFRPILQWLGVLLRMVA